MTSDANLPRPLSAIERRLWQLREPLRQIIHSRISSQHRGAIDSEVVVNSVFRTYLRRHGLGAVSDPDDPDQILRVLVWLADGTWKGRRIGKLAREIRKSRRRIAALRSATIRGLGGPAHGLDSVAAPDSEGTSGFDPPDQRAVDPRQVAIDTEQAMILDGLWVKVCEFSRTLPEFDRQVLELTGEGESRRTIATILGISPGRVGNVQRRLYEKIRAHLGEQTSDVFGPSR